MRKLFSLTMVLLVVAGFVLSACQTPAATPTQAPAPTQKPVEQPTEPPAAKGLKVGLVTDVGGVNDKSFNQSAWAGVQKAAAEFGMEAKFIESKQPTDYEKNIDQYLSQNLKQRRSLTCASCFRSRWCCWS